MAYHSKRCALHGVALGIGSGRKLFRCLEACVARAGTTLRV